ncbi:prolyl oligopeptidase family serine peptidase [Nocardiopsis kunsanensis]|uniref:prolyl oligopeptidase family serine peptidase n=1 Tax=Nocardiopsis kunsanensis TaxID=141693 RepID=UPI00047800B2|nr:prolyl oligopeptidase family serine peptidase [Nocardiopsis kunsanensis]
MPTRGAHGAALSPDRESAVDILHGRQVTDPYRWLESAGTTATRHWLAERDREFDREAEHWPLRRGLSERIQDLVRTDLWSAPRHRPGRLFTTVRRAGDEHPRVVAMAPDATGGLQVVFDPVEQDPSGRTTLDSWEPDPTGRLIAVQTSSGGVERGELRVLCARTGAQVGPSVRGLRYSHVAWLPDRESSPAFYYVRRDDQHGTRGVWLRRVACGTETLVHACTAPGTVPGVRVLGGRRLLVTESHGTGHRTDLWIADLHGARPEHPRLHPVQVGVEAETEARLGPDGLLYLRTTLGAPLRRVCAADPDEPGVEHWREVVPEDPGATLDAFATCPGPALLVVRTRLGISEARVHDTATGRPLRTLALPGEGMVTAPETAPDGTVFLGYADVAVQQRVLELAPGAREPRVWPPHTDTGAPVPEVRRSVVWCRSADGTEVPVTVFDPPRAGTAPGPTILHAYGGFGRPRQFGFSATVLAWLLSGGRYAVAHVRGGGDAGRSWHLRGARRNKPRAVEDLVAAAGTLVEQGLCTRSQLCLSGGSAGGLLVLAAAMSRPRVCGSVIASAPLADMVRFERLGLGRMWTREFGTVTDPEDLTALLSYSPYHRALARGRSHSSTALPRVLLTGFDGDTRTDAAHPRKMCAALLGAGSGLDRPPALLRYERDVGHGPRAVSRAVALAADAHAFAAHETGLLPR